MANQYRKLSKTERERIVKRLPDAAHISESRQFRVFHCGHPPAGWAIRSRHKQDKLEPAAVQFLAWLYTVGAKEKSKKHDEYMALELMKIAGTPEGKTRMTLLGDADDEAFIDSVQPFTRLEIPRYWTVKAFFSWTPAVIEKARAAAASGQGYSVGDGDADGES